jgi:hypothetical protein
MHRKELYGFQLRCLLMCIVAFVSHKNTFVSAVDWEKISSRCKTGLEEVGNNTDYQNQVKIFIDLNKNNLEKNCPCSKQLKCVCDLEKTWLGLRDMQVACQNAQGILCSTDIYSTSKELFVKKESYHCKSLACTEDEFSQIDICSEKDNNCHIDVKCTTAVININHEKNGAMVTKYLIPIGIGCGIIIVCLFVFGLFHVYRQERDSRWSFDDENMVEMAKSSSVKNATAVSRGGTIARRRTVSSSVVSKNGYSQLSTSDTNNNNNASFVDVDLDSIRSGGGSIDKQKAQLV